MVFVVGDPSNYADHADNQWPSDHAGVFVEFKLEPGGGEDKLPTSELSLDKSTYGPGETIIASYRDGLGNARDWIGIYEAGQTPGSVGSTAWFYTNNSHQTETDRRTDSSSLIALLGQPGRFRKATTVHSLIPRWIVTFPVSRSTLDTSDICCHFRSW